jgi:O-methyltransferase involved in polyketide biosynthesis
MEINLEGVQQTLLLPLYSRAKLSEENNSILVDLKAIDIVKKIQYDFSKMDKYYPYFIQMLNLVRAKMFDNSINEYLKNYPKATIINLGAGLDTTFYRMDNKQLTWYDIDLPDVIEIRRKLIPETDRSHIIEGSIFELQWVKYINKIKDGVLFISGGVLEYFNKNIVRKFLSDLADNFPESEIVFNTTRKNLIASFFINRMMKHMGMKADPTKLGINYINKIKKLDKRIVILEQYSIFSKIKMEDSWDNNILKTIKLYDKWKAMNIVHLKFLK